MRAEKFAALNPCFASVTYGAGGSTQSGTLDIAEWFKRDLKIEAASHYTCIGATKETVNIFLEDMQKRGLKNIVALRGDAPKGQESLYDIEGGLCTAKDLISHIKDVCPEMGIAATAYPDPHPKCANIADDILYTVEKNKAGASFFLTQLFFEPRIYFDLVHRLQNAGCTADVIPGVLIIRNLAGVYRMLSLCDVRISGKLLCELEALHKEGGDKAVEKFGLEYAIKMSRSLLEGGAKGVHLYTLNRIEESRIIVDACSDLLK